jgi:putative flippase GtrA
MMNLAKLYQFILINKRSISFFLAVGGISAVINFASFAVLWNVLNINYQIAVSIAFILSVLFHFSANRAVTFRAHQHKLRHQLPKYVVMLAINYSITLLIVHVTVETFHLSPYLGLVIAVGTTMNLGYLMLRFWIFHQLTTR